MTAPEALTVAPPPPLLVVESLAVTYGSGARVLQGVSLSVGAGEVAALLGTNGAGKTTFLRAVTGLLPHHLGRIVNGTVVFDGRRLDGAHPDEIVRRGVSQVLEGRRTFAELTVEENLRLGAHTRRRADVSAAIEEVFERFEALARRRTAVAGYLSGGEQQMLAIGRALVQRPRLLLLDEPSLGLAPIIVDQIRETIGAISAAGTSILLIEQNAAMALAIADHAHVLHHGRVTRSGSAPELVADDDFRALYLGVGAAGRRSYRELYERRREERTA